MSYHLLKPKLDNSHKKYSQMTSSLILKTFKIEYLALSIKILILDYSSLLNHRPNLQQNKL